MGDPPARVRTSRLLTAMALGLLLGSMPPPSARADEAAGAIADANPLEPADTSSPRDTLESFLANFHEAVVRWQGGASLQAVEGPLIRALRCLDLSDVPEAAYDERSVELGFLLKGVLQRIALPPSDQVPGDDTVKVNPPEQWRIPDTEIVIGRQDKGPRLGEYLFTRETVARLPKFFELVQHLPVRPGPTATPDAFDAYRLGPGRAMPHALAAWIQRLPGAAYATLLDQPLWKWAGLLLTTVLAAAATGLAAWLGKRIDRALAGLPVLLQIGQPLAAVATIMLTFILTFVMTYVLRLSAGVGAFASYVIAAMLYAAIAWLAAVVVNRIGEAIVRGQGMRPASLDTQLVRLLFRLLSILAILYVAVHAATQLGVPVGPLLAGVGVGGLAIALAVRPLLENIIAGFVLFADKPISVGDFCMFGDKQGTIEQIGLRSTRIRGTDRTVITVPNAEFAQLHLVNFTRRDRMLLHCIIGLRYETTTEQLRYVLAKIREMLIRHVRVSPDPARVRFLTYGASSLDLEIFAYVSSADYNEYLGIREDLNFRIKDIVEEAGTGFAFPSQTLYMTRDQGPSPERAREVAAEVEAWRADARLPFPDFAAEERDRLSDTLPFPPEGSPHHRPPGVEIDDSPAETAQAAPVLESRRAARPSSSGQALGDRPTRSAELGFSQPRFPETRPVGLGSWSLRRPAQRRPAWPTGS